jgi:hypothetical protein
MNWNVFIIDVHGYHKKVMTVENVLALNIRTQIRFSTSGSARSKKYINYKV